MVWANARDILALMSAEEFASMGAAEYRALCEAAGEPLEPTAEQVHKATRTAGGGAGRCQWAGGYCSRYVSGQYCSEHEPSRYGSLHGGAS